MDAYFLYLSNKFAQKRNPAKKESIFGLEQLKTLALWRACGAEFIATLLFVFLSTAAVITANGDAVQISFAFGLSIASMIQFIGHVSGGHLNPAVSIAMVITRHISIIRCVLYVIAQCVGAICGSMILKVIMGAPGSKTNYGATTLLKGIEDAQGFGMELMLTFMLVAVIYGTTDENRVSFGLPSVAIGFAVTVGHLAGVGITGPSMNPARSLGPAVASGYFRDHWIYWVGPIAGGVLAALMYRFLILPYRNVKSFEDTMNEFLEEERALPVPAVFDVIHTSRNTGQTELNGRHTNTPL